MEIDSKVKAIISDCHHAFNEYVSDTCICTQCGRVLKKMTEDEELTTSIVYNVSESSDVVNMSSDLLEERRRKFARNANDITCALTNVKCPKCQSFSRVSRDQSGIKMFVCIKCRHTFVY